MKLLALLFFVLNLSVMGSFDFSYKCNNKASLDQGMTLEINASGEALLTYNNSTDTKKVYLSSISKNRKEIIYKTDSGSMITAYNKNGSLVIKNLSDSIPVSYSEATCTVL